MQNMNAIKEALEATKEKMEACLKEALGVENVEAEVGLDGVVKAAIWIEGEENGVQAISIYQLVWESGVLNLLASKRFVQTDGFGPVSVLNVPIALTASFIADVESVIAGVMNE